MANKNPSEKTRFAKGNQFGKLLKGKPKKKTIIKNRLKEIASWDTVEAVVEKNIMELLTSKNMKEKLAATKAFVKFFKPKKRVNAHGLKRNLVLEIHGIQKLPEK